MAQAHQVKYGWRPDLPDQRDKSYQVTQSVLPSRVDLRPAMPPVYDQGQLGSCTANAVAAHLDFNRHKQGESFITPSRLFIYYNERVLEGTTQSDSGATIRESVKAVKTKGASPESEWPYDISQFAVLPPASVYVDATKYEALSYLRVGRLDFRSCLAEGYPLVIGFTVYSSFEAIGSNGVMPMPKRSEKVLGGHAVCVVGYDDTKQVYICRNSWGTSWGDQGYFYMPYKYISRKGLASDFWTLRQTK